MWLSGRSTSIHVLEGLLGLLGGLKLDIGGAPGQVWVESVHWHFDRFDFSVCGEDLLDVILSKLKQTVALEIKTSDQILPDPHANTST